MSLSFTFTEKQRYVYETPASEIFYGGAAGGGKSFMLRALSIILCAKIPHLQVFLFRRLYSDIAATHIEGPAGYKALLHEWEERKWCSVTQDKIRFWNGSVIFLQHCKDELDKNKYLSAEMNVLLMDEASQFTESQYRFFRGRARLGALRQQIEEQVKKGELEPLYLKKLPLVVCASNPGNVGHGWLQSTFVDYAPPMTPVQTPEEEGGMVRVFVPARLEDNPYIEEGYENKLLGLGDEELVRAMRYGDWNILSGAFFKGFSRSRNVLPPFSIPRHYPRVMAYDHGWYYPFSIGWFAFFPEPYAPPELNSDPMNPEVIIPQGSIILYKEWYGSQGKNRGLGLTPEEIAYRVFNEFEEYEKLDGVPQKIEMRVADPAIFKTDRGESIADVFDRYHLHFERGDNDRIRGWQQMDARISATPYPTYYIFENCLDSIKQMGLAVRDPKKPEDIDTDIEDHALDMARYAIMAIDNSHYRGSFSPISERYNNTIIGGKNNYCLTLNDLIESSKEKERKEKQHIKRYGRLRA